MTGARGGRIVEVAAAVILGADGCFLLGRRPAGTFYAGYWEFPGGKIEPGESAREALVRELHEELGIDVAECYPWLRREFVYPHAHVRLNFFRVTRWTGELRDLNHDQLAWQHAGAVTVEPMLPANAPVLRALSLPDFYGITHAGVLGVEPQLTRLDDALSRGLRLVQVREPELDPVARRHFAIEVVRRCRRHDARVLVNADVDLAREIGADGVHLKSSQLRQLRERPALDLVGASCHDQPELERAIQLGADLIVVGSIHETPSHPGARPIGWDGLGSLAGSSPVPVYALGGVGSADKVTAWQHGAHGIAAIRSAWNPAIASDIAELDERMPLRALRS